MQCCMIPIIKYPRDYQVKLLILAIQSSILNQVILKIIGN